MKIIAINGSHKGKNGNTDEMVKAFLKGAQEAGAEFENIYLSDKNINHCKVCNACWFQNPGHCIIKDDMEEIMNKFLNADICIIATPLYFDNISSKLTTFMDRLFSLTTPYFEKSKNGETRHMKVFESAPKLIMMSNCAYPERTHFQVISNWIKRVARNASTEVIGEIYTSQSAFIRSKKEEIQPILLKYMGTLEIAGMEIVTEMKLSEEIKKQLEQKFVSDEIYIEQTSKNLRNILNSTKSKGTN
jgi:multimeric flavodoxin WrbA